MNLPSTPDESKGIQLAFDLNSAGEHIYPRKFELRVPDLDVFENLFELDQSSYEFFSGLGFDETRAWLMAVQGVNHSRTRNLIQKGCSHEQAFAILF